MDSRTRLLDVALTLFASRGFEAVGVQEIVEAAGVTKPTLYHHFGNKIGLLRALIDRHGTPLTAVVREAAAYQGDLPLTLRRLVGAYFREAQRDPAYHRFRLALALAPPDTEAGRLVSAQTDAETGLIEAMFQAAERDHGNMRGRSRLFTISFTGTIQAYVALSLRDALTLDDELAFRAVQQFMHGIYS